MRGRGSESTAAEIWGVSQQEYMQHCDPWPLNPEGELLLGVKLESPEGIARADEILAEGEKRRAAMPEPQKEVAPATPAALGLRLVYSRD